MRAEAECGSAKDRDVSFSRNRSHLEALKHARAFDVSSKTVADHGRRSAEISKRRSCSLHTCLSLARSLAPSHCSGKVCESVAAIKEEKEKKEEKRVKRSAVARIHVRARERARAGARRGVRRCILRIRVRCAAPAALREVLCAVHCGARSRARVLLHRRNWLTPLAHVHCNKLRCTYVQRALHVTHVCYRRLLSVPALSLSPLC